MRFLDFTAKQLIDACMTRDQEVSRCKDEAALLQTEIDDFVRPRQTRINELQEEARELERYAKVLNEAAFIRSAIDAPLRKARAAVQRLERDAAKRNITVAKAEALRKRLATEREKFQGECPHPFVLRTDGYDGRNSPDDEGYPGKAGCVVCGRTAYDADHSGTNAVMPSDGTRIVRRMVHEVAYRRSGTDKEFEPRLKEYAALATTDEVTAMFFGGEERLKRLHAVLSDDE